MKFSHLYLLLFFVQVEQQCSAGRCLAEHFWGAINEIADEEISHPWRGSRGISMEMECQKHSQLNSTYFANKQKLVSKAVSLGYFIST